MFYLMLFSRDLRVILFYFFIFSAIGYVLIGNGLYDEAIKHFSVLLQVGSASVLLSINTALINCLLSFCILPLLF